MLAAQDSETALIQGRLSWILSDSSEVVASFEAEMLTTGETIFT